MTEHRTVKETFGLESEEVARMICDLRYDEAERLYRDVSAGYAEDSVNAKKQGHDVLAELLHSLAMRQHARAIRANIASRFSKPRMK